ncbi:hypothetical protein LINPERPRIM_LOCUS2242 [Linum perenne]
MAAARILISMMMVACATSDLLIRNTAGLSPAVVCSEDKFQEGDPRIGCMEDFLEEITENCLSTTKYCQDGGYKICKDGTTIYGSGSSTLTGCLEEARQSILNACVNATGAQSIVDSGVCQLRYEIYPYLD